MGLLFNRAVRVSFGIPGKTFTIVEGLKIAFSIEKNSEKFPNKANIQIFNLNETSRSELQQKGVVIKLDAGYGTQLDEIFVGSISKAGSSKDGGGLMASTQKSGNNIITTIESMDGQEEFRAAQVNESLGPGATGKQVIESLVTALKLGIGAIKGISNEIFQNGIVLSGNAEKRLDEITAKMGLEWSIQDGKLNILPPGKPSEDIGILLTPDTGLLDSPIEREDKPELGSGKFIEFRSVLRGKIQPQVSLQIASREVNGFFKIRKAVFNGDSRQGPFDVSCEAKEVSSGATESSQLLNLGAIGATA